MIESVLLGLAKTRLLPVLLLLAYVSVPDFAYLFLDSLD